MKFLGIVTAAALAAGAGAGWAQDNGAPLPAVVVAKATRQTITDIVTYNGRLRADQSIQLVARVSGFLEEVGFHPGDKVKQNDVLFSIEPNQYVAAVQQAEGSLLAAQATVTDAKIERDRQAELVRRQTAAQTALDTAEAALGRAQGAEQQAQAALDTAKLNLSYTKVTAPFDGVVGERSVDPGALVDPLAGPLATLTKLDPMHVNFEVPTARLRNAERLIASGAVDVNQAVRLILADGEEFPGAGKLDFIDSVVNQGTDSITLRATFANPDGKLLHDELVRVHLAADSNEKVLTVPLSGIQRDLIGDYVMKVDAQDVVKKTRVTVAHETRNLAVIQDGLSEGDLIVTEGINKVSDGVKVDAKEDDSATGQPGSDAPADSASEAKGD